VAINTSRIQTKAQADALTAAQSALQTAIAALPVVDVQLQIAFAAIAALLAHVNAYAATSPAAEAKAMSVRAELERASGALGNVSTMLLATPTTSFA